MSVAQHRIAACTILICSSLVLVAVGRTLVEDSPNTAQIRQQFDGRWVATRVAISPTVQIEGSAAAKTTAEFVGRTVRFAGLVDAPIAAGVYNVGIAPAPRAGRIDFKLDAGWVLGTYRLAGDHLTLCVNTLKLPEQLGVPARGRPERLHPSEGQLLYEFERVRP